jgi:hypothetical protein
MYVFLIAGGLGILVDGVVGVSTFETLKKEQKHCKIFRNDEL